MYDAKYSHDPRERRRGPIGRPLTRQHTGSGCCCCCCCFSVSVKQCALVKIRAPGTRREQEEAWCTRLSETEGGGGGIPGASFLSLTLEEILHRDIHSPTLTVLGLTWLLHRSTNEVQEEDENRRGDDEHDILVGI